MTGTNAMISIQEAASQNKILSLTYRSKDGKISHRSVEPYEIKDNGLYAYDLAKGSIRKFLLDGIMSAEVGGTNFTPRYPIKI